MLMLLSCKFCCLSYMTFLAAILDTVVQYLREVSVLWNGSHLLKRLIPEIMVLVDCFITFFLQDVSVSGLNLMRRK